MRSRAWPEADLAGAMAKPLEAASSLKPTRYLDYDHKDMKAAIAEACTGATTDREKAIGIFNFVCRLYHLPTFELFHSLAKIDKIGVV
jgi:hypothetical protein